MIKYVANKFFFETLLNSTIVKELYKKINSAIKIDVEVKRALYENEVISQNCHQSQKD